MSNDTQMDDKRPDQKVDPVQDAEGGREQATTPTQANFSQAEQPALTQQPTKSVQETGQSRSTGMNTGDVSSLKDIKNREAAKYVNSGEMSGSPKLVAQTEPSWFIPEDLVELHSRWTAIQIQFVDDPCSAVEQAEAMVAETVERVKQIMADQVQSLSQQWLNYDEITTEELRVTLLNYRSLLNHMFKL